MLNSWLQILPVFIYKRIAKKVLGTVTVNQYLTVHQAAKDVLIVKEIKNANPKSD